MQVQELIDEVIDCGIKISLTDKGDLSLQFPTGHRVSEELIHKVRVSKAAIVQYFVDHVTRKKGNHVDCVEEQEYYALSHAQRRLWVIHCFPEASAAYNITDAFVVKDADTHALVRALEHVMGRHESLRTTFISVNGEPKQKIHDATCFTTAMRIEDLQARDDRSVYALTRMDEEITKPFDLEQGPLIRVVLLQMDPSTVIVMLTMHHIISDAWSMEVLLHELTQCYVACRAGQMSAFVPLRVQYKDFVAWHNKALQGPLLAQQGAYWIDRFKEPCPPLNLPLDFIRPEVKTYRGAKVDFSLGTATMKGLTVFSRERGTTLFIPFLTAVIALLYKYSGRTDIVVGTPVAGREHVDFENQIGFYLNTLPLRVQFDRSASLAELFKKVKEVTFDAYANQQYPFEKLVEELKLKRDQGRSPLFDVMVVFRNGVVQRRQDSESAGHLDVQGEDLKCLTSKFDLTFTFYKWDDDTEVSIEYNTDLFSHKRIRLLGAHLQNLLDQISACADLSLDDVIKAITLLPRTKIKEDVLPFCFSESNSPGFTTSN